ncbi:invasion associated locus B family protein [Aliiroseovarius sp.]|uniref:invasion associated locus B family protein n=1 Tax=Aliiroseovarius sp. TaxID=1872442 RepID=UPI003BAC3B9B
MNNRMTRVASLLAALTLGFAPAAQAQQAAPSSLSVTYQDWTVRCASVEGQAGQVCEMVQDLNQADTGRRVLSVLIRQAEGETGLTLVTPFGLKLSEGVKLGVDGTELTTLDYETCLPSGCIAALVLSEPQIESLQAGAEAQVTLVDTAGQDLSLTLSLAGFSGALTRLGQECCGS